MGNAIHPDVPPGPRWTDCVNSNKDFTSAYDAAIGEIRKSLGSYERMAQRVTAWLLTHGNGETPDTISGQSLRRWITSRKLPIEYGCTLLELARSEGMLGITEKFYALYPFVKEITAGGIDGWLE